MWAQFPGGGGAGTFTAPAGGGSSGSESKPQLEFYGRLNDPTTRGSDTPGAKSSPLPIPDATGSGALSNAQVPPSGAGRFTVQIAAMEREAEARKLLTRVRSRGYLAEIRRLGPNDRYYRVWVGDFPPRSKLTTWPADCTKTGFLRSWRSMSKSP